MNAKQGPRSYVDFEPSIEWSHGEETDILRVYLPGFKREHIKVQVDSYGNLRTTGERPLEGNLWSRFWKDFRIPEDCRVSDIRAKLENETLFIMLPKSRTSSKPTVPTQLPTPSKPALVPEETKPTPAPPKPAPVPKETKPSPGTQEPEPAVSESKPTGDQASVAGPRNGRITGKLGDMLSSKKEEAVDDMQKSTMAQPIGDKKETDKREQKPVEEKKTEKSPITEATGAGPSKELLQPSRVLTGLPKSQRGLLLNVAVALIVLVGIGFYLSFKLRRIVDDGDHSNSIEL